MQANNTQNGQQELLMALRSGELPSERSKEYWSDREREQLRHLYESGVGISEIALLLQRSENAVIQQLITMKLLVPDCNKRARKKKRNKCKCPLCLEHNCPYFGKKDGLCYA